MGLRRRLSVLKRGLRARRLSQAAVRRHHLEGTQRGWRISWLASLVRERGARDLFLFRAPSGDQLVLKVYERAAAARETYDVLKATEAFTDLHVKARFIVPEDGVVAMDYAGAIGLDTKVGGPDHAKAMERAGAWLRRFHADGDQGPADYDLVAPIRPLPNLPDVAPFLRARRRNLSGRPTRRVQSFVDFRSEHLIEGAGRQDAALVAIDRPRHVVGFRELDLGRFLVATWRDTHGQVDRIETRDAFLEGYAADDLDLETLTHATDCLLLNQYLLFAESSATSPQHRAYLLDWARDIEARRQGGGRIA